MNDAATSVVRAGAALRKVTVQSVEAINGLSGGLRQALQWRGQQWVFTMSAPRMAAPEPAHDLILSVQMGEIRGYFAMSHRAAEELIAVRSGLIRWREMDEDLAMALLQHSLDDLAGWDQTNEINALTIDRADNNQDALSMPLRFDIALRPENAATSMEAVFLCGVESALRLVPLTEKTPFLTCLAAWGDLSLPMVAELGWTDLSIADVMSLQEQDVVFPDLLWSKGDVTSVCLRLGPQLGLIAALNDGGKTCKTTGVTMAEQESDTHDVAEAAKNEKTIAEELEQLPIRLSFDLGEKSITLKELCEIEDGHIFDLGLPLDRAVNLRVNGLRIGEGEIVDVDGRIGVAVSRIARAKA